jgi:prepilin-type N-terminal cleavage/methylation domain-containing protein
MEGRRGLTIIEVLAAVAVLAAILAMVYPALDGLLQRARVDGAVAQIEAGVASGRARARESGRPVEVRISGERVAPASTPRSDGGADQVQSVTVELRAGAAVQAVSQLADEDSAPVQSATQRQDACAPLVLAVCLPDGTVEAGAPARLVVGQEQMDLCVSRWTGGITATASLTAATDPQECPPEQFPEAPPGGGS